MAQENAIRVFEIEPVSKWASSNAAVRRPKVSLRGKQGSMHVLNTV
jgi:hypothetical protein